jgi:hypothetical protein
MHGMPFGFVVLSTIVLFRTPQLYSLLLTPGCPKVLKSHSLEVSQFTIDTKIAFFEAVAL